MKTSKKRLIAIALIVLITTGGISIHLAIKRILPTLFSANLEEILAEALQQPVSITSSSVQLFPRVAINLTGITIGIPAKPLLKADGIRVRLSARQALFGRIELTGIELDKPLIYLDYEAYKRLDLGQNDDSTPTIKIHDGKLIIPDTNNRAVIERINGTIDPDQMDIEARALGGKARVQARNTKGWEGRLVSEDMDLSHLSEGLKGVFRIDLDFDLKDKKISSLMKISGRNLRFPWAEKEIPSFTIDLNTQGNENILALNRISATTPFVQVNGSGTVRDLRKGTESTIKLDMSSSTFVYEQIVAFLPTKEFDTWLSDLLTSQIRGGSSRFPVAHYEGTIKELITFDHFLDNIHVVEDVMGQSFGAGFGPERITGITGQVLYSRGDIILKDLRGSIRDSVIEKVSVSFPRIVHPYWRVGVDVKIDMAARDFLDAWKAAGTPQYVYDLFAGLSAVKGGRVAGAATIWWDNENGLPVKAKGKVTLTDCAYQWGSDVIQGNNALITSEAFDSPLEITGNMIVGGRRIESLEISLADPFGAQRSSFALAMEGLVSTDDFSLGKGTFLKIKGTGTGPDITATADVTSENIVLFGTVYTVKDKPIRSKLTLKGKLSPEMSLTLEGQALTDYPGKLLLSGTIGDEKGRLKVKGAVDLHRLKVIQDKQTKDLSGNLMGDILVAWGKDVAVSGKLTCTEAALCVKDTFLVLDGPVHISDTTLASRKLKVTKDDFKLRLSDWSLKLADAPFFKGDVTIYGLKLPLKGKGTDSSKEFKTLTAKGRLTLVDSDFYGIPVEEAQSDAYLKDGVLKLSNIQTKGESVSVQGSASADSTGVLSYDTTFSLKDVSIHKFLNNYSAEQDWIRGSMNLEGALSGSPASVNGTVNLLAKEGKLKKYALFSRIFALLNVYKIVQTRDLELTSKNFPYNTIVSTFVIKDSLVHFDDFFLDSNSLQFSAVGDYSLKKREIDAVMGVQPFETLDKAVSSIPVLGWILTGDKGRLLVVSLKINGNIDNPSVKFAPITTISDPAKKSLIRALKLPSHLLEKTRGLIPGQKKNETKATS